MVREEAATPVQLLRLLLSKGSQSPYKGEGKRQHILSAPFVPEPMMGEGLGRAWGGLCSRALAEELKQSPPSCCAGAGRAPLLVPAGRRTHLSGDNGLIVRWILMKLPGSAAESASA